MDQNYILTRDHQLRIKKEFNFLRNGTFGPDHVSAILVHIRNKNLDQNRIFESSSSRENELLKTLFWTKKYTYTYNKLEIFCANQNILMFTDRLSAKVCILNSLELTFEVSIVSIDYACIILEK